MAPTSFAWRKLFINARQQPLPSWPYLYERRKQRERRESRRPRDNANRPHRNKRPLEYSRRSGAMRIVEAVRYAGRRDKAFRLAKRHEKGAEANGLASRSVPDPRDALASGASRWC